MMQRLFTARKKLQPRTSIQAGFTLVELMIATSIFAVIMLFASAAIIYVSKTYTKGEVESSTQETSRNIISLISQDIQLNQATSVVTPTTGSDGTAAGPFYFCVGSHEYAYNLDTELSTSSNANMYRLHDLIVTDIPGTGACPAIPGNNLNSFTIGGDTRELLSKNERLGQLYVHLIPNTSSYQITVTVGYGDDDLLHDSSLTLAQAQTDTNARVPSMQFSIAMFKPSEKYTYQCANVSSDGSFCAVSSLTTTASAGIN